jgi:hypothetical protein
MVRIVTCAIKMGVAIMVIGITDSGIAPTILLHATKHGSPMATPIRVNIVTMNDMAMVVIRGRMDASIQVLLPRMFATGKVCIRGKMEALNILEPSIKGNARGMGGMNLVVGLMWENLNVGNTMVKEVCAVYGVID